MALTRRFFAKLAADFRNAQPNLDNPSIEIQAHDVWSDMVIITATALAEQNAMFNYGKFYEACGMPAAAVARVSR